MKQFIKKNNIIFQLFSTFLMIFVLIFGSTVFERKFLDRGEDAEATVDGTCSGGYTYVGAGDFCIEEDLNIAGSLTWQEAALDCQSDGARLCTASEWTQACQLDDNPDISLSNMQSQEEWADDLDGSNSAVTVGDVGGSNCSDYNNANVIGHNRDFRCCKNTVKMATDTATNSVGCPDDTGTQDWVGVADFCIMEDDIGTAETWEEATEECANNRDDSRLCTVGEWNVACQLSRSGQSLEGDISDMIDGDEWMGELISDTGAIIIGATDCTALSEGAIAGGDSKTYRCCINKQY